MFFFCLGGRVDYKDVLCPANHPAKDRLLDCDSPVNQPQDFSPSLSYRPPHRFY